MRGGLLLVSSMMAPMVLAAPFNPDEYELMWSDEFDGTSLDRTVWNVEVNGTGCGNHELQHYIDSPATVRVSDGLLHLTAVASDECGCGKHDYISGRINTLGKQAFRYGVVQASIRLPETADGLWPAFWMMGDDISVNGWPRCGEIDILEMGHADGIAAGSQTRLFNGALHWGPGSHYQTVGPKTSDYSLQDGKFHTYTLVWTEDAIEMYLDDESEPYLQQDISECGDDTLAGGYFHKPGFILFNLAVGGDFPGIHSREGVTALADGCKSMDVDYVRVYRRRI